MALAPFQLWLELPQIASAVRVSSTVTVTTASAHGMVSGAYIEMESATGAAGTSMNGAYQITVTSGTAFTYTAAGSAGTATTTAAAVSVDLFNPLVNYSTDSRQSALYAIPDSLAMSASGDGGGASLSFAVAQDDTPSAGPWFTLIPDESRVRLVKENTGTTPAADKSNCFFVSTISAINASLNDAGQGTLATVSLSDPTSVLERLAVYGRATSSVFIPASGISRASNTVTVTTQSQHGFTAGQVANIANVNGGGTATFNGNFTIATVPTTTSFTYANTGANETGNTATSISSAAFKSKSTTNVVLTLAAASRLQSGATIKVSGLTSVSAEIQNLINGVFQSVIVDNAASTITVRLPKSITAAAITATSGTVIGVATASPTGKTLQNINKIKAGETDAQAITRMLAIVNQRKYDDYPVQRVINTGDSSKIVGSSTERNKAELSITPTTLRSTLDSIVETYSGQDQKERRYWVNGAGQLCFTLADTTAVPSYATAPYKIITSGAGTPNTTTGAATLAPHSLTIAYDHNTVKNVVFSLPSSTDATVPEVRNYIDAGYPERKNAPKYDAQADFDGGSSDKSIQLDRAAKSFLLEAHKPMLSGQFTLRGAGTLAGVNDLGFSAGYAQTGAATFALVTKWEPGQYVDISCDELGIASGLYRVELVDWSLSPGSFFQVITVTFNRRPTSPLTQMSAKPKGGNR